MCGGNQTPAGRQVISDMLLIIKTFLTLLIIMVIDEQALQRDFMDYYNQIISNPLHKVCKT